MEFCSSGCPPGLSIAQTNRVIGKQSLNIDIVSQRKVIQGKFEHLL